MREPEHQTAEIPVISCWLPGALLLLAGCGGSVGGSGQGADPVIQDLPVAYVERSLPINTQGVALGDDERLPATFHPGAKLLIKSQASPSAPARDVSEAIFPAAQFANEDGEVLYDIKHLSASFDGERFLFSAHQPVAEDEDETALTWNIWEFDLTTFTARRLISSDLIAQEGDDLFPAYLPDGRIVFASSRQRQSKARLLDEGKPQFPAQDEDQRTDALSLHVMNGDGSGIEQITFNQSHDSSPVVRQNGMIAFARWDNAGTNNEQNIYQVRPDGSGLTLLYGSHSHQSGNGGTVQFARLAEDEDGSLLGILRPFSHSQSGGEAIRILVDEYLDANQAVGETEPSMGEGNNGQSALSLTPVVTGEGLSPSGRFRSISSLRDSTGRYLVNWTPCRIQRTRSDEEGVPVDVQILPCTTESSEPIPDNLSIREANPLYGLWVFDPVARIMQPVLAPLEGKMYSDAILLASRALPSQISHSPADDPAALEMGLGVIEISSLYDWDGIDVTGRGLAILADPMQTSQAELPYRYVRIEKPVSLPDTGTLNFPQYAFGVAGSQLMREIVGYIPVEPDGSARFYVPADTALALSIIDRYGRRVSPRHQNWLQVRAGEVIRCQGCHDAGSRVPHGREDARPASLNAGAPTTGLPFPNTRQEWFADMGETMAQTYSRFHGVRAPTLNPRYDDEWTNPEVVAPAPSEDLSYQGLGTLPPATPECLKNWQLYCRSQIHYPDHIQPLWERDRGGNTCTLCHAAEDAQGLAQIPAAQLSLSPEPSSALPEVLQSYFELFASDFEQELVDGVLQDRTEVVLNEEGKPVFETNERGEPILDTGGNPIPVLRRFPVNPVLSGTGALASSGFFSLFLPGGSHVGWLNRAEIRLLAEWLDIGAQYYNDPFVFEKEP